MSDRNINRDATVARLTALWGLTEAGLGGVIHALRIPFTGIVVGSTAIILITLIAHYGQRRSSVILRSMMVVLLIKAGASPHTPVPAYVAVAFQGVAACALFRFLPGVRLPAMILGVFALVEGVCQKFIMMTLLYGKSVWEAIDLIGQKLGENWGIDAGLPHASWWVMGIFALYYGVGGVVVGWLAGRIPGRIDRMLAEHLDGRYDWSAGEKAALPEKGRAGRKWKYRRLLPALLIMLLLSAVFVVLGSQEGGSGRMRGIYVLLRTLGALVLWFGVIGPVIRKIIIRWQNKKQSVLGDEVSQAMMIMPHLRQLAGQAWRETEKENRFVRWYHFLALAVVYSLLVDAGRDG